MSAEQTQIDAINNILELLNEKYGRSSCTSQMDLGQEQQEQHQQQQQQQQQQRQHESSFETSDSHLTAHSLCRVMRSRL